MALHGSVVQGGVEGLLVDQVLLQDVSVGLPDSRCESRAEICMNYIEMSQKTCSTAYPGNFLTNTPRLGLL